MTDKWLFRVDVATERETEGEEESARGVGHAYKCISVSEIVKKYDGEVHFSVEGESDTKQMFDDHNVSVSITSDHQSVIADYEPDVIVIDINYCPVELMAEYRKQATVVNLAPRGICKYYADLSFTSARIEDVPKPSDATVGKWYAGPEYAILNPEFTKLKSVYEESKFTDNKHGIIIQMGGVDKPNITGQVIEKLDFNLLNKRSVTVVAGPLNPHINKLKQLCRQLDRVDLIIDPSDYACRVASHELGILGTGISTYEALSVGVPSLNIGQSSFHDKRGRLLEQNGLGRYIGRYDKLDSDILNNNINSLLDSSELRNMRVKGVECIDGKGPQRIVKTVINNLK